MEYQKHLQLLNKSHPTLGEGLTSLTTLEHVLNWMKERGLALASLDMVTQDEYSHDLILPLPVENQWLSFAMT
jgi:hypothetical protein